MTYILPNHFIEKNSSLLKFEDLFCLQYTSKIKNEYISARITTHCMIILLQGTKILHVDKKDFTVEPQEILFLSQNNYFMSEIVTNNNKYEAILVYFDDKFISDFIAKYDININKTNMLDIMKINYSKDFLYKENINLLVKYIEKQIDKNLIKLKIEEILLHSLRYDRKNTLAFLSSMITTSPNRIKFILESNIDLIQNVNDMCKITRLSPNNLRKYIQTEYKINPKKWLDTKRLEKASLMLKNTDKTISQISTECGYATVSWFISKFKSYHKKTPKEFRHKV